VLIPINFQFAGSGC